MGRGDRSYRASRRRWVETGVMLAVILGAVTGLGWLAAFGCESQPLMGSGPVVGPPYR